MAQSELTVTPSSPTPPTNFSCTGAQPQNPPNYTKLTMADLTNWSSTNPKVNPPPYFDDGTAGTLTVFAANTAALASGSGATAGGTEGTYPGTGTGTTVNNVGAVPASTSIPHEGAGTEVVVVAPGSRTECPTASFSCLGNFVPDKTLAQAGTSFTINEAHKSSGSVAPAAAPTITGLLPVAPVGNGGTTPLTVNGTNFRQTSVVNIGGVPYQTQYNSATQLKVINAPKRTSAGNTAITVTTGATTTAGTNWVFS